MRGQDEHGGLSASQNLNQAWLLAILGGCLIGLAVLLRQLPSHHLSRTDVERLLFYRYLREKGKLES
ncbi:MAG TPA: hypothetical protein VFB34_08690 [Chloroflexota bacterium]|nr:hypothetical protein [Chloroflexota bacterium]